MPGQVKGKGKLPTVYCSLFTVYSNKTSRLRLNGDRLCSSFGDRCRMQLLRPSGAEIQMASPARLLGPSGAGGFLLGGARNETEGQGRGFRVSRFGFLVSGSFKKGRGARPRDEEGG